MSQQDFTLGQRYVSDTEPELGLGVVLQVSTTTAEIGFPAAGERRTYSIKQAPLSRVRYNIGEKIKHQDGQALTITHVMEQSGCLLYEAVDADDQTRAVPEFELDSFVQFSKPRERLFSGQIDKSNHFSLRYRSRVLRHHSEQRSGFGLGGARVSLLPHQLYIASQVASRYAPRVLLADEVGLGKTIEAGLILHRQLLTGRAHRALVIVPDTLMHQWLVEMLRRFNLSFTLLDEARCQSLEGKDCDDFVDEFDEPEDFNPEDIINPFESAQLVLCSLSFITDNPERLEQASAADWDLLLVDEAHHLEWNREQASLEYQAIEQLARVARGLLLLTATPEQLGVESHFARLRLLDPDRYYDLEAFIAEQKSYQPLSELVEHLNSVRPEDAEVTGDLFDAQINELAEYLDQASIDRALAQAKTQSLQLAIDQLVEVLLDRHGTGRVLLRNTRHGISGFPERILHLNPIELADDDAKALGQYPLEVQLKPEGYWAEQGDWWLFDPRVEWLKSLIKAKRGHKILVICADGDTAQSLELYLRLRHGIASTVFHEGMNLINRDRAAAYFADMEEGAQVLIASEIGSEGRNFQFSQDLVLFDLPLNPDLLEQRIGRLDRIGQAGSVNIHLPVYHNAAAPQAQAKLADWYHHGINAFEHTCAIGQSAFTAFADKLVPLLADCGADINPLLKETADYAQTLNDELQAGRDKLLELNSCRPGPAQAMVDALEALDEDDTLPEYLMRALDSFNVDYERHSDISWVLHPGEHMRVDPYPGLPESGLTVTFDRDVALSRDDMSFLSWEHPLVRGTLELIADTEFGNTAVATLKLPPLKPGTMLVEAVYCLYTPAPASLQLSRYISQPVMRVLMDTNGKDFAQVLGADKLNQILQKVARPTAQELVRHSREQIGAVLDNTELAVAPLRAGQVAEAKHKVSEDIGREIERLQDLAKVNPNIRSEEIDYLSDRLAQSLEYLDNASLKLDAARVIVAV
ncbi:RNA polymerase-associated protein RapA [Gilvimarinus sp. SDUM040013]|uniref:RNA polymerase-associated protein RapA n=1 Tax=Gilvimarinus gilvus TaxID=3058038 RepID=A0ABU4RYK5_9GAMM|nr:RNA polymerase-associated protein RapA [Gilvimarinus sp. SDUM040013]MDO3386352.1 RNA polymerase-associated protein RapA [Gilvimarinus sp. SDUM040013]MDX6849990.1 RNA polymerase-associated protein RapA [Gilvimarinus sp. SDUM040013]